MRVTKVPEGGAKRRLLDAAEALVVEKGFASVSIRDVTGAAGANVASINYHFRNREGLMDMVAARVLEPLCSVRQESLGGANPSSPESLVRAYLGALPIVATTVGIDEELFPRLAGRVLALPDAALPSILSATRRETSDNYRDAFARVTGAKEADWAFFEAGIAQSLNDVKNSDEMKILVEDWIAFGVRGLSAAARGTKRTKVDDQGMLFDL